MDALRHDEVRLTSSCLSFLWFERVTQSSGDSASGHHAQSMTRSGLTSSCFSFLWFERVIQTSGDSASGHHAQSMTRSGLTSSCFSFLWFERVIQTSGDPASGHRALVHRLAGADGLPLIRRSVTLVTGAE
jgi:hypothetical protein